jgi:phosphate transport system substrate-binding protein
MHRRQRILRLATTAAVAAGMVAVLGTGAADAASKAKQLPAATLNGGGSTFIQGYVDACREGFKQVQPNLTVNYPNPGGGSGAGRTNFANQTYQYAGSDAPYPSTDLSKVQGGAFFYVPTVAAPITVSYNVSGVTKPLNFDAATLAKIFQGDITTWNDPAIQALNKGVGLPSTKITIARRTDSSGTTQNFTTYLTNAAGSVWKLGTFNTQDGWSSVANTQGGAGNPGVANIIKATDGAVGYVDFSDAVASQLKFGNVLNSNNKYVTPSVASAKAALVGVSLAADGLYNPLNSPNPTAYPITSPTWVLVYQKYSDGNVANAVKAWAQYLITTCQKQAKSVDYATIPKPWVKQTMTQVNSITAG